MPIGSGSLLQITLPHNGQSGWGLLSVEVDGHAGNYNNGAVTLPTLSSAAPVGVFLSFAPSVSGLILNSARPPLGVGLLLTYKV